MSDVYGVRGWGPFRIVLVESLDNSRLLPLRYDVWENCWWACKDDLLGRVLAAYYAREADYLTWTAKALRVLHAHGAFISPPRWHRYDGVQLTPNIWLLWPWMLARQAVLRYEQLRRRLGR